MTAVAFLPVMFTVFACITGSLLLVLVYLDNRKSRIDDGINAFRSHIGALSMEARRNSVIRDRADEDY